MEATKPEELKKRKEALKKLLRDIVTVLEDLQLISAMGEEITIRPDLIEGLLDKPKGLLGLLLEQRLSKFKITAKSLFQYALVELKIRVAVAIADEKKAERDAKSAIDQ